MKEHKLCPKRPDFLGFSTLRPSQRERIVTSNRRDWDFPWMANFKAGQGKIDSKRVGRNTQARFSFAKDYDHFEIDFSSPEFSVRFAGILPGELLFGTHRRRSRLSVHNDCISSRAQRVHCIG